MEPVQAETGNDSQLPLTLQTPSLKPTTSNPANNSCLSPTESLKQHAIYRENYHTFDSQQYINYHPTASRFSMYSMYSMVAKSQLTPKLQSSDYDIWSNCGEWYRKFCFTSIGMQFLLSVNIILLLLSIFLIIYETILLLQDDGYYWNHALPITFIVCDVIITFILIIEVLLHCIVGYQCCCYQYLFNSTYDNKIDFIVMTLSLFCCGLYATNYIFQNWDNLFLLAIRFIRDIIRIIRCYLFFKILYGNLTFDFNEVNGLHINNNKNNNNAKGGKRMSFCELSMDNKSATSQWQWEEYAKQRELNPTATMLSINTQRKQSSLPAGSGPFLASIISGELMIEKHDKYPGDIQDLDKTQKGFNQI